MYFVYFIIRYCGNNKFGMKSMNVLANAFNRQPENKSAIHLCLGEFPVELNSSSPSVS